MPDQATGSVGIDQTAPETHLAPMRKPKAKAPEAPSLPKREFLTRDEEFRRYLWVFGRWLLAVIVVSGLIALGAGWNGPESLEPLHIFLGGTLMGGVVLGLLAFVGWPKGMVACPKCGRVHSWILVRRTDQSSAELMMPSIKRKRIRDKSGELLGTIEEDSMELVDVEFCTNHFRCQHCGSTRVEKNGHPDDDEPSWLNDEGEEDYTLGRSGR